MLYILLNLLNMFKVFFLLVCRLSVLACCECVPCTCQDTCVEVKEQFLVSGPHLLPCSQTGLLFWCSPLSTPGSWESRFSCLCLLSHCQTARVSSVIAATSFYIESGIQILIFMCQVLYRWAISLVLLYAVCLFKVMLVIFLSQSTCIIIIHLIVLN